MAEKKKTAGFDEVMQELKKGSFSPIYILMGDEAYFIDKIADYIADNALAPEERDFNQEVVFGADVTAAQIVDMAKAYPMMAPRRVVIVKEAQGLKNLDAIEKYLVNPSTTSVVVLCHKNGTIDGRKKIVAKAQAVGVVFESKKLKDYQLPAFVNSYLKMRNATIDNKAASMIADSIGSDLNRMASEMDKILISLPDNDRRITHETVEKQIGISKDFNGFELRDAIVNKDVYKANLIIKYFDSNPKAGSLFSFLPLLFNYFQNLMLAFYAPDKSNENAVAQHLDLKSVWGVKDYLTGMRNYTAMKTLLIISKIREIDAKSKGVDNPNTPAGELMKELIFFILH